MSTGLQKRGFWVTACWQRKCFKMGFNAGCCTSELWFSDSLENSRCRTNYLRSVVSSLLQVLDVPGPLQRIKPKRFKSGEGAGHAVGATCLIRYSGKTLLANSRTARRKCGGAPSWMNHKWILAWILPSYGSLRDVRWFETDVSGLPIGSSFKSQPRRRMNSIQPLRKPTISHVQRFVLNVWNDAQCQD